MYKTEKIKKYLVKYQISAYSGEEIVYAHENEDNETIIAKCKNQLKGYCSSPIGYASFKIIEQKEL